MITLDHTRVAGDFNRQGIVAAKVKGGNSAPFDVVILQDR